MDFFRRQCQTLSEYENGRNTGEKKAVLHELSLFFDAFSCIYTFLSERRRRSARSRRRSAKTLSAQPKTRGRFSYCEKINFMLTETQGGGVSYRWILQVFRQDFTNRHVSLAIKKRERRYKHEKTIRHFYERTHDRMLHADHGVCGWRRRRNCDGAV